MLSNRREKFNFRLHFIDFLNFKIDFMTTVEAKGMFEAEKIARESISMPPYVTACFCERLD